MKPPQLGTRRGELRYAQNRRKNLSYFAIAFAKQKNLRIIRLGYIGSS